MEVEPLSNRRNPKFLAIAAGIAFLKKIHTWAPFPDRDLSTKGLIPLSSHFFLSASTSLCHSLSVFAKSVTSAPFS